MEGMMIMTGLICECGEFAAGWDLVALVTQIKSNMEPLKNDHVP